MVLVVKYNTELNASKYLSTRGISEESTLCGKYILENRYVQV